MKRRDYWKLGSKEIKGDRKSSEKYGSFRNKRISQDQKRFYISPTPNTHTGKRQQLVKKLHCAIQIW